MFRLLLILLSSLLPAAFVAAEDGNQSEITGRFKRVVPAQMVMNQRVEDPHGVLLGTVRDIVIDRKYGRVAFFAVDSRRAPNQVASNYFIPPGAVDKWTDGGHLRLNISFSNIKHVGEIMEPVAVTAFDPMLLAKLYTAQGAVPYWNENASAASDTLDLTTADELDGRLIRDADWNKLGRVEEVLLAPMDHWKIAYLSIAELRGNLRPEDRIAVPMGALSRKTISPTWLVDVPEDFGLLTKTFEVGDWPQEIDRGWIEFSQEKYGRSALGGLVDLTHKDEEPLNTQNP